MFHRYIFLVILLSWKFDTALRCVAVMDCLVDLARLASVGWRI